MFTPRLTALLLVLLPTVLAAQSPIDKAAWLTGCWEAKNERRTIIEMWMAPAGGMMLGGSRTVANGVVREFEHSRLRAIGDTLVYTALPSGQITTDFTGVPGDGVLTFENPSHDFPTRITYRRIGNDSMTARVEGPGQGGAMRGFDVPMRKVGCE
ncbi:MAG TPA: DUF6265 family protein [Gemmatimonadales bacterium]|nr:DUF6265 family protein [Gemmatimonadales bacterium]